MDQLELTQTALDVFRIVHQKVLLGTHRSLKSKMAAATAHTETAMSLSLRKGFKDRTDIDSCTPLSYLGMNLSHRMALMPSSCIHLPGLVEWNSPSQSCTQESDSPAWGAPLQDYQSWLIEGPDPRASDDDSSRALGMVEWSELDLLLCWDYP
ncbi:Hypothetical predicted protein [Pelobates cultripes]|uniref:Uncharacterized protein n=1 Tax=Pelobates cultripes TaxID=61616 RepID=A0AAD1SC99_PELCU|nr:Hypothetical predicted protein [Pelobates cultripes]